MHVELYTHMNNLIGTEFVLLTCAWRAAMGDDDGERRRREEEKKRRREEGTRSVYMTGQIATGLESRGNLTRCGQVATVF